MSFLSRRRESKVSKTTEIERPHLDLSGPRLTQAFEALLHGSEALGGVERYVDALKLKTRLFQDALLADNGRQLDHATFISLCPFMSSVRRRIGSYISEDEFSRVQSATAELLSSHHDTAATDRRVAQFCANFPNDKSHRWVKDLAAEILHNTHPEQYPLMNRWVWDRKSNTGVLREIWFADDIDHITININDGYGMFLMLREELSQFLHDNGVFRDILNYIDLLSAQVYADYICAQGGSYLRADFASPDDPMQHVRRLLGLDGVKARTGRTRLKAIDGEAYVIETDQPLLG
ncbi:MAG: hypothetical protein ACU84Q_10770 [Gammaproteobacteria bacterium]